MHNEPRRGVVAARLAILLAGGLVAAGGWYFVGFSSNSNAALVRNPAPEAAPNDDAATKGHGPKKFEKPTFELLFPDWPEQPKPALVLALTGEMNGYLRPCGCSEGQSGGLARRAGLLAFL